MAKREILIVIAFASLIYCSELEDSEQKKRGVGKATALNSIPTGAQKQEYSYNVYQNSQTPSSQSYQNQVSSSFYPNQATSQYYSSANPSSDTPSPYSSQHATPQGASQFVPLNFIPNPGYQTKYQAVPSKSPNVQLAIVPQSNAYPSQSILPYHQLGQSLFAPNPAHQVGSQQSPGVHQISQFNVPSNYQPLQLGNAYLSHPSAMVLLAQPNPSIYNNLLYSNPVQGLFNYPYPSNSQTKYSPYPSSPATEYEKYQGPIAQNAAKEENEVGTQNSDYNSSSDPNSSYKNAYSSRTSYGKLQ